MSLEVVKYRDLIPVVSIPRFVPGLGSLTIEVVGEDFSSVEEVYLNEVTAPNFIVLDKTRMWVELSDSATRKIDSLEVVSSKFTKTNRASKLQFKLGTKTVKVTGILKLVQLFTKWILQSPGSSIFYPQRGGGLQELAGRVSSSRKMQPVLATITRAVDVVSEQIKSVQTVRTDIPLSEKLLSASLMGLDIHDAKMLVSARIRIRSMAGQDAVNAILL